ncbi:hypothetical protein ACFSRY_18855 [Pontibacter locisalis]|uniref:Uncharacterized protein n=1 Tax=Pontibacter locisalis TaxID=1719035 RepID=A0ABW5IQK5_9BACT
MFQWEARSLNFFPLSLIPNFGVCFNYGKLISENRKQDSIPLHHLTSSPFLAFTTESTDDETFDGLHRHDFYEIIWFAKTVPNESVEIDFVPYQLKENEVYLLRTGLSSEKNNAEGLCNGLCKRVVLSVGG